jgi:hypothetical protein
MPYGLTLAESLNESMMDRIWWRCRSIRNLFSNFLLPGASSNVGVLAGYGKEMQDITSSACSTYITGVMGDVLVVRVKSLFWLRTDGKAKAKQLLVTVSCMRYWRGASYTRSGSWDDEFSNDLISCLDLRYLGTTML